jgi:hypothetical protein
MPIILSPKRKKRKKIEVGRKTYLTLGSVFVGLAGLTFLIFGSGIFKIETVEIQGADATGNNTYLVNLDDLKEHILEQIPKLKNVELKRDSFKGLIVNTLEKQPRGIYCIDSCYYFNIDGVAYEPAPKTQGFLILSINDERDRSIDLGDAILDEIFVNSIYKADESFEDILDLSIEEYIIPSNSFDEFRAKTEEGWLVYMATGAIKRQIEDLKLFLDNQFKEARDSLIYTDTRLEDRVYYKVK